MAEPARKFSVPAQLLHWLIAALILFQVPLAWYMIDLPVSPDKLASYALHKSLGITILGLSCCRLAWRWLSPPPPLPADMRPVERALAQLTHGGLYLLSFAMPLSGWMNSSAANFPVSVFRLFTLPDLVAPDPQLHERLELLHRLLSYGLLALLLLHVGAALYHHVLRRDNVLLAMLPFARLR